ncbi:MAG: Clp1/GlmU family protein [Desulfurococcaceae archaeon]
MPVLKLAGNEAIKLYGPMSVKVIRGVLDVHGKPVYPGDRFIVHKTRNYVAIALEGSELDITMIDESQIQSLDQRDPYLDKRSIVNEICNNSKHRRIVVIGCADCGKTSLVTLLYNKLLLSHRKPVVIDSDVGQADIGPPGFISMGFSKDPVYWISELEPLEMRFIGDIKPQGYTHVIISEVKELVERAEKAGFDSIVIDTDGWVRDESGVLYKVSLLEYVKPDVLIILGDELKGVFSQLKKLGIIIYEVGTPYHRKIRTREERKLLRSMKYREFLENSSLIKLKMDSIYIRGYGLFHGIEILPESLSGIVDGRVLYASRLPGTLNIYGYIKSYAISDQKKVEQGKVRVYSAGFEKGIYCGVGLINGSDYPCVIEKFDFESREIILKTRYSGNVNVVKLSRIRLTEEFTEEYIEV